jgi:hypothetical protein
MKFRGDILDCSQFKIVDFLSQKVIQKPPSHIYGGCHEGISGFIRFSRLEEVHVTRWRRHEPDKKHIVYLL